jgi:Cu/Ag efflux pump CusA
LQYYEQETEAAKQGSKTAGRLQNPNLSAQVGQWMVDDLAITKSDGLAWSLSLLKPIEFSKRLQLKRAIANRDIDMAELGLSIKVPLWNNRSSRTEIERIRLKQAQASLEMTRREVAADLMNALQTYSLRMPSMKMWRDGAILVIVVLLTLLGNWKAALIVAAAIPLSFLFAITGMVHYGISGNLMSLGAEFVPTLDEGSFTAMVYQPASTSLKTSLKRARRTEAYLTTKIPEVTRTFSRIGTSEVATDPMSPGEYDLYIFYKPQSEWRKENGKTITKERLVELISNELSEEVPEQTYFFAQPIEMRFNEMLEGIRSDIAVKVFGEDIDQMESVAEQIKEILESLPGTAEAEFETQGRTPVLEFVLDRAAAARWNVHMDDVNETIRCAMAGQTTGIMIDGNRRRDLVLRLSDKDREQLEILLNLPVRTHDGGLVRLEQLVNPFRKDEVDAISRASG